MILASIVATTFFFSSGCSLIGLRIGAGAEASKTYQSDEIAKVRVGQTIIVSLKDGAGVRRKYGGLIRSAESVPFLIVQEAGTGDRVLIALDDVRQIHRLGTKNAKTKGFLIGLAIDAVVFFAVVSSIDMSFDFDYSFPSPY